MLKDILASIKEPGTVNIKKDLDLWLVKDYQDLGSHGRGKTGNLHPSSISGCPRAEVYKRIGAPEIEVWPFTGKTQRIFDNGSSYHERTQNYYARMGILWGHWRCHGCSGCGERQVFKEVEGEQIGVGCRFENSFLPECPRGFPNEWEDDQPIKPRWEYKEPWFFIEAHRISGYTDGILKIDDVSLILELKSMKESQFRSLGAPKDEHIEQAHLYMEGFEVPAVVFQYENKNDQDIKEFYLERDDSVIDRLFEKADMIWNCLGTRQLPPRDCRTMEEGRWCPFKEHCFNDFQDNEELWDQYERSEAQ